MLKDVLGGPGCRVRIAACADKPGGFGRVVPGVPQRYLRAQERPGRAWLAVSHPDAASIENPVTACQPVEVHMRVAEHDGRLGNARPDRGPPLRRAVNQHHLVVAAWRSVTEQGGAESVDVNGHGQ